VYCIVKKEVEKGSPLTTSISTPTAHDEQNIINKNAREKGSPLTRLSSEIYKAS
jgi:hypothetical protein